MSRCPNCGSASTTTEIVADRPYVEAGLPHFHLRGVECRRCTSCGNEAIVLPNLEGLHRTIARALARKPARLLGIETRFMRKYLGLSKRAFAELLGTDEASVLSWESAERRLPARIELAIRVLVAARQPVAAYPRDEITKALESKSPPRARTVRMRKKDGGWKAESFAL